MTRPKTYTIAVVLMVLYSLTALLLELPNLVQGAAASEQQFGGEGPPYVLTLLSFALAVLGFVSSYGVWRMQKWGVVLTLVIAALSVVPSLLAILFAPPLVLKLVAVLGVAWCVAIIALLLWPQPQVRSAVEQIG